jgi:pimeloyl-ACP methyl ester carboxylesterase
LRSLAYEPAELLVGLGERPVGRRQPAVADADGRRRPDLLQRLGQDEMAARRQGLVGGQGLVDAGVDLWLGQDVQGPVPVKLLAEDFTVYVYDRRGRGDSGDTQPYAIEREVDDLAALIAEAGGSAFVYAFSSGGLLALYAAARGLAIPKLALFEPPIEPAPAPAGETGFTAELAELVASGRRREAVEYFHRGIGVPDEVMDQMTPPVWAALRRWPPPSSTTAGSQTPCRSRSSRR